MIEPLKELLTFKEVSALLPKRRQGKSVHVGTLWRWSTVGCRGIRLETKVVGGQRYVTRQALEEFIERVTLARGGEVSPLPRTPTRRRRDHCKATKELEEIGIR